jgi:uncharacterized protein
MKNTKISLDLRFVVLVLLALMTAMLVVWKPWTGTAKRTIDITGEAVSKAEPDQYQFNPQYQKKGTDRAAIQQELTGQINTVITKLEELGVAESDITLQSSTYDNYYNDGTSEVTSNSLTVTVTDKALSQKVQDYLLTTTPTGQITPYPTFSNAKRREVEKVSRVDAIADAKSKAKQTAGELGLKVGKVVAVSDPQNGVMMPMYAKGYAADTLSSGTRESSLPILPGKQDVNYSVQVTFELK